MGQETIDGVPSFVFTYTLTMPVENLPFKGTGKAWVGISDKVPHQVTLDGTVGDYPMKTLLVYSYGVRFDIQAPAM